MQVKSIAYHRLAASPLFQTYTDRFSLLQDFYPFNPSEPTSWGKMADAVDTRSIVPPREALSDILIRQNTRFGADERTLSNIRLLSEPDTLVVSTGQQTGLLTGPLYTIYKAVTTVKLAERISNQIGRPIVPVFWMASDDHDFAEINHVFADNPAGEITKLDLRGDNPADRRSAVDRKLGPRIESVLSQFLDLLPDGAEKESVAEFLISTCVEDLSVSDSFAILMTRLFKGRGLILVDPTDVLLKPLMKEVFIKEIGMPLGSTQAVHETSSALKQAGYSVQVERPADAVNLFFYHEGHRNALTYDQEKYHAVQAGLSFEVEELLQIAREHPEKLSHNVVTRPIVQDTLFPSLAYVAGPSEIAYYAQFKQAYAYFGLPFPIIYPRASLSLITRPINRILKKQQLDFMDFTDGIKKVLDQRLRDEMPEALTRSINETRAAVQTQYKKMNDEVLDIDVVLQRIVKSSENKAMYAVNRLEAKALQALKRKNKTVRGQIFRAERQLYPFGNMQERVYTIWPFISFYGYEFMDTLFDMVDETEFTHRVMEL